MTLNETLAKVNSNDSLVLIVKVNPNYSKFNETIVQEQISFKLEELKE